jgi:hypothetical protein
VNASAGAGKNNQPTTQHTNHKETIMSKSQNSKKSSKKAPAKTLKEKQAAKRDKKNGVKKTEMLPL